MHTILRGYRHDGRAPRRSKYILFRSSQLDTDGSSVTLHGRSRIPGYHCRRISRAAAGFLTTAGFSHGGYLTCIKSAPSLQHNNAFTHRTIRSRSPGGDHENTTIHPAEHNRRDDRTGTRGRHERNRTGRGGRATRGSRTGRSCTTGDGTGRIASSGGTCNTRSRSHSHSHRPGKHIETRSAGRSDNRGNRPRVRFILTISPELGSFP